MLLILCADWSSFAATGNPENKPAPLSSPKANKTIRLAVGGFAVETDPPAQVARGRRLADLVTVHLTSFSPFELVERLEIERVAHESSLSLSRWTDPASASRVGGLLRADWLLLGAFLKYGGTNCLVARLVDAQTGIVRDMTCLRDDETNLTSLARAVGQFAINSPRNISRLDQRVFLGVGGFEDVGVNNLHPELRKNLRLKLEETFRGTAVAVVERTMVNPLLEEFRLYSLGLSASAPSQRAMPAYFLIDGTYQSRFEGGKKIELMLKVEGINKQMRVIPITAPPGNQFLEKVAMTVRDVVNQTEKSVPENRNGEALAQLARGRERARLPWAWDNQMLGGYAPGEDDAKRLQNITEAIQAFETALLLDPKMEDAKLYLGRCLLDPAMSAKARGRNYLEEVLATTTNHELALVARDKLAESYLVEDDARAVQIYFKLSEQSLNPDQRVTALFKIYPPMERLHQRGRYGLEEGLAHIRKFQRAVCDAADWAMANPGTNGSSPPLPVEHLADHLKNTFTWYVRYQNFDQRKGKEALDLIVPDLCDGYPRWAPHILVTYVLWCASLPTEQSMAPPIVRRLTTAVEGLAKDPGKDPLLGQLQEISLAPLMRWCNTNNQPVLLETVLRLRGYGHTPPPNAHLYAVTNVPPPRPRDPVRFDIGKPVVTLPATVRFVCDGDRIWLRNGDVPAVFEIAGKTLTNLKPPKGLQHRISCVAVSKDYVWFGTDGSGLFEYDKRAQSWRRYTEEHGLTLPRVTALYVSGQTLWMGFGDPPIGGAARLDIATREITAFTPGLDPKGGRQLVPHNMPSQSGEPPKNHVIAFAEPAPGELWLAVSQVGLQRYFVASNSWTTFGLPGQWDHCLASFAMTPKHLVLGGICDGNLGVISDRHTGKRTGIGMSRFVRRITGTGNQTWANRAIASMTRDGDKLWLGGVNFLALLDLQTEAIERLAEFGQPDEYLEPVRGVQVVGQDLWVAVENELYFIPRSTWASNLTAAK